MYSAVDIAKLFVNKGIEENEPVTQMKLQKLVFFAHGLYLALKKGQDKLVKDEFEAWQFGPVIPEIYEQYQLFGAEPIHPGNEILQLVGRKLDTSTVELEGDYKLVVDQTWNYLKNVSGIQLSDWTHQQNSAWDRAYVPGERNLRLRDEDIIRDFTPFIKDQPLAEQ